MLFSGQFASDKARKPIPTKEQTIIHGAIKFVTSLFAPVILTKLCKRTAFIICGTLAALSMATGIIYRSGRYGALWVP